MGMRAVHVVSRTPGLIVITIIERTIKNGGHVRYRIQWCSYILYVLQTFMEIMFNANKYDRSTLDVKVISIGYKK